LFCFSCSQQSSKLSMVKIRDDLSSTTVFGLFLSFLSVCLWLDWIMSWLRDRLH
jgi:hypothetical protein